MLNNQRFLENGAAQNNMGVLVQGSIPQQVMAMFQTQVSNMKEELEQFKPVRPEGYPPSGPLKKLSPTYEAWRMYEDQYKLFVVIIKKAEPFRLCLPVIPTALD